MVHENTASVCIPNAGAVRKLNIDIVLLYNVRSIFEFTCLSFIAIPPKPTSSQRPSIDGQIFLSLLSSSTIHSPFLSFLIQTF